MHYDYFITNEGKRTLSSILDGILPKTNALDFLVGYFYFSGIQEIKDHIEDKKMRILVGLEMDKNLLGKTAEVDFEIRKKSSSVQKTREEFFEVLTELFNSTDLFENEQSRQAFKAYYEKIKNGTLEIRKTKEPCHAKMYIFSYKDDENGEQPGNVITGSSNFTYSGLRGQREINVRLKNNHEYREACHIFENLWENASIIVNDEYISEFEEGVIKHIWLEKLPSPYMLYIRCLYEYFYIDTSKRIRTPKDITREKFTDLKYQIDAVRMALSTIEKHNGVIISDVVGLGKSIVGSTVAHNLNLKTIVLAPPHLVAQWDDYMNEFRVSFSKVFSRGVIGKALEYYRENSKADKNEKWLIIIDEAHNYRNEYTQDYAILHELCQGNNVMLLTATPFNNQPSDIYSMLKLFQIPTKSTLQAVSNLGETFRELISKYKTLKKLQKEKKLTDDELQKEVNAISDRIRGIIEPLVIRRSRLDLRAIPEYNADIIKQGIDFPEVSDPQLLNYPLGALSDLYISTLQRISPKEVDNVPNFNDETDVEVESVVEQLPENSFKAARYQPITYVKEELKEDVRKEIEDAGFDYNLFKGTQRNLAKFMRNLLVRRFESSQHAFRISLSNMLSHCENIKNWAEKRQAVPVYKKGFLPDIQEVYEASSDTLFSDEALDTAIEKLQTKGLFELKIDYLQDSFLIDLDADIEILQVMKREWDNVDKDPKTEQFIAILKQKLHQEPDRKIVVFSQFADTVEYLEQKLLATDLPIFAYTSKKANDTNKKIIRENFDAGVDDDIQKNQYKILIATDAISEGYNLHRAGSIFNYDIPYNPTRVIQRVGRINRINKKKFDKLFIYNYFPSEIGESEIRVKEISTLKMAMIHAIMGEDTKILTKDEQLQSFFSKQYKDLISNDEQQSWDTEFRVELSALEGTEEMKEALSLPHRVKIRRRTSLPKEGVLVFSKFGNDFVFKMSDAYGAVQDIKTPKEAFDLLKASKEEKALAVSDTFDAVFDTVKKSLYSTDVESDTEKQKRDALDKIRVIMQAKSCPRAYLEDLRTAIEYDAVSGYTLRAINRLKPKDYGTLTNVVCNEYIQKLLQTYDAIGRGKKELIFAEEIESESVVPETGKLF